MFLFKTSHYSIHFFKNRQVYFIPYYCIGWCALLRTDIKINVYVPDLMNYSMFYYPITLYESAITAGLSGGKHWLSCRMTNS